MKVDLYYYVVNNGDGSASPRFFTTAAKRDAYRDAEERSEYFEGFCESTGHIEFTVKKDGKLVSDCLDPEHESD